MVSLILIIQSLRELTQNNDKQEQEKQDTGEISDHNGKMIHYEKDNKFVDVINEKNPDVAPSEEKPT